MVAAHAPSPSVRLLRAASVLAFSMLCMLLLRPLAAFACVMASLSGNHLPPSLFSNLFRMCPNNITFRWSFASPGVTLEILAFGSPDEHARQ